MVLRRQAMEQRQGFGDRQQRFLGQDSTPAVSVSGPTRFTRAQFTHGRSPFSAFLYSLTGHFSLAERSIPSGGRPAVLSGGQGAGFRRSTAMAVMATALTLRTIGPPMAQAARVPRRGTTILHSSMARGRAIWWNFFSRMARSST